ncbi:zinc metalloprotease [Campylobacter concisus]|nr:zinc metalloprotease [Campylobacter concisus]
MALEKQKMARKTPSLKQKSINLDFYGLSVLINFKTNVKSMRLRVGKDAKITLSMPFYSTHKMALSFLEMHRIWLENTYKKALANLPKDDEIKFLGQVYKIKFDENFKEPFFDGEFVFTPNLKSLERFKKTRAKELFLELVSHFQPFINKPIKRIVIRNSKTRWGSCNHKKGYINLSLRLIEKPLSAVRYVVLHELTHLLYPHHQKSFYDFIEKIMPDYKKQEQILKA